MPVFLSVSLSVLMAASLLVTGDQSSSRQWAYITEGVGISGIFINRSTASDVAAALGTKFTLHKHNEYSCSMEYADLGLAFYYCLRDKEKRIFLIAVHHGMTQKGIIIGRSTLKDVYDAYGKEDDVTNNVYEYKGVQFYVESTDDTAQRSEADQETEMDPSRMRVVEIDVMAPDKSSNFCDGI
jgi:hypothetical protein